MKNLVFLLALVVIGFGVLGWFLDWYSVAGEESTQGRHRVHIEFDTQKIRQDTSQFIEKSQAKLQDKLAAPKDSAKESAKDQAKEVIKEPVKATIKAPAGSTVSTVPRS